MSSTYARLYVHLVWATRGRAPWIVPSVAPRLHGLVAAWCVELGCVAVAIGGVEDHVHALVGLKTDVDVARLARELKARSSAFMHHEIGVEDFAWQDGYGAFTLRDTELETVRRYVVEQPRHHREETTLVDWERVAPPRGR
jgi:REP element-mobilizing transposase RayT